jgi:chorismate mutase
MSTSRQTRVAALRGATTAAANTEAAIVGATTELLGEMLGRNRVAPGDVISIVFTATPDLDAAFPASAARALGMADVPLLCAQEIAVPGALRRCVRVLMHLHSVSADVEHVYLGAARSLRGDLLGDEG